MPQDYDAVVVGARVAGAATALLLARAGARVLLVERDAPGTDTLSTHALMRGAVMQLARWGLVPALEAAGTPPVRSTSSPTAPSGSRSRSSRATASTGSRSAPQDRARPDPRRRRGKPPAPRSATGPR
jgi:2-polyprenyl-6-methoxyphenol hydroxylase-like FAD-dependent oxidoreductase